MTSASPHSEAAYAIADMRQNWKRWFCIWTVTASLIVSGCMTASVVRFSGLASRISAEKKADDVRFAAQAHTANVKVCLAVVQDTTNWEGVLRLIRVSADTQLQQAKASGSAAAIAVAQRGDDGTTQFAASVRASLPHPDCSKV